MVFDVVEVGGDAAEFIEVQFGKDTVTFFARTGAKMSISHQGTELP